MFHSYPSLPQSDICCFIGFREVVYGAKWLPAVAALQILCFYGLNRSLLGTTEQLYLASGKPEIRTKLNLLQLVFMGAFDVSAHDALRE